MRKITLTLACILGLGTLSQAQVLAPLKMDIHPDQKNIVEPSRPSLENPRREDASGWFSHLNAYSAFNGFTVQGNTFVSWLFPDTAKLINSDGSSRRVYFSTTGSTFDPKDPVFFNSPAQFSRFTYLYLGTSLFLVAILLLETTTLLFKSKASKLQLIMM